MENKNTDDLEDFDKEHLIDAMATEISNDLSKNFTENEKKAIIKIYEQNIIGKELGNHLESDTMYKLIAHIIAKTNDGLTDYEVFDYLREYDLDSTEDIAKSILAYYKSEVEPA